MILDEGHWYENFVGDDSGKIKLRASADSNWAQCKRTRKSVAMIILRVGTSTLYSQATGQSIHAQSSGEADFYAMVSAASARLAIRHVLENEHRRCQEGEEDRRR